MPRPISSASPVRNALLLGDAAGLTDEFTAEVIAYAVRPANLGAEAVLTSENPAITYTRSINREIQPELNAAANHLTPLLLVHHHLALARAEILETRQLPLGSFSESCAATARM